jgi:hypothetical protein
MRANPPTPRHGDYLLQTTQPRTKRQKEEQ